LALLGSNHWIESSESHDKLKECRTLVSDMLQLVVKAGNTQPDASEQPNLAWLALLGSNHWIESNESHDKLKHVGHSS